MDPRAIQAALTELREEVQRQRDEIQRQRDELSTLRSQRLATRPKPCLPDPEKFSGQTHKFDTWLPSIRAKLRVDGEAIGDAIAQFYYVYLNLDSHVQAMVLLQLGYAEEAKEWDYKTILAQLSRVYDNPNKVQEAEDKLFTLKQGTDTIPVYIAKFERVLYEARGQEWPDVNKISTFRNGLGSTLRSRLAQQLNLPRTYAAFIRVVQQLAGRSSSSSSSVPLPQPQILSRPGNGNHHSDPMELNAIGVSALELFPRARSTSPERRQELREEGRCVRCGSYDHWVKYCQLRPFSPDAQGRTGKVTIAAIDDDTYDED